MIQVQRRFGLDLHPLSIKAINSILKNTQQNKNTSKNQIKKQIHVYKYNLPIFRWEESFLFVCSYLVIDPVRTVANPSIENDHL